MRIHLTCSPNKELVPFDYQQKLIGVLHHWLGSNDLHDRISLYSYSWLKNGKAEGGKGLQFRNGASWFISFYDDSYLKIIINTILESPEMFCGMSVLDVTIEDNPDLSHRDRFMLGSPILIKRYDETGRENHFTFQDDESSRLMKETIINKMQIAGLESDESLEISFDQTYDKKKAKKVNIHGIGNMANVCPVIIKGRPETKLFIWLTGIGNSTGSSFGSIY